MRNQSSGVCIFCGGLPLSREHVIPRWTEKVIAQDQRTVANRMHYRYVEQGGVKINEQRWQGTEEPKFIAKCVCKDRCNSGWMEDIENEAAPILTEMMLNRAVTLDRQAQDRVSNWLGLKAIIDGYSHTPITPMPREWINYVYVHHTSPLTWNMRVGRYIGAHVHRVARGEIDARIIHPLTPIRTKRKAFVFTIAMGYFFGQVIGFRDKMILPFSRDFFSQIWPHPLLRADMPDGASSYFEMWPPKRWLTDPDFENVAHDLSEPR